jgi:uncharacterized repeat protein (TIGR04076 family)
VRITVVGKRLDAALAERFLVPERAAALRPCRHEVGETFLIGEPVAQPEGMCPWAWSDLESFVRIAAFHGTLDGGRPANSWVRCCTDAFRPVTFLIEPLDDAGGVGPDG